MKVRKRTRQLTVALTSLVVLLGVTAVTQSSLALSSRAQPLLASSEVGFTSLSPNGISGGAIIPASCESGLGEGGVAHWPYEPGGYYDAWGYWVEEYQGDTSGTCYSPDLSAGVTAISPSPGVTGQSELFSSRITNIGAGTALDFPNVFQILTINNVQFAWVPAQTVSTLAPSAFTDITSSYAFSTPGTYRVQSCANTDVSGDHSVSESSYSNNCSGWTDVVITTPTLDLTANSTYVSPTGVAGEDKTLTASVKSATTITTAIDFPNIFQIVNSSDALIATVDAGVRTLPPPGAGAGISAVYNFPSPGTFKVRACANTDVPGDHSLNESNYTNNCDLVWKSITISIPPDLTAGPASPITPPTAGSITSLSATISNANGPTGATFNNFFQRATTATGTDATDIPGGNNPMNALDPDGSATAYSNNFVFSSAGTYYIRACADKSSAMNSGVISESDELNNCSNAWQPVTVTTLVNPTMDYVTINSDSTDSVLADGSTPYTITATASHPSGGSSVKDVYVQTNETSQPSGGQRGFLAWSLNNDFPGLSGLFKSQTSPFPALPVACTGGGQGAIFTGTNDSQYLNLLSCSTTVSGNTRTTLFVVTYNTNFTSPTNNELVGVIDAVGASGIFITQLTPPPYDTFNLACSNGASNYPTCSCTPPQTLVGGVCTAPSIPVATLLVNGASTATINSGQSATLSWSATNSPTSCVFLGTPANDISTGDSPSGSVSTGALNASQNYQLTCSNSGGTSNTSTATVTVNPATVIFNANPNRGHLGSSTTVSWNVDNVDSCNITKNGIAWESDLTGAELDDSKGDTITGQATYILTCLSGGSSAFPPKSITVNVLPGFQEF